MKIIDVAEFYTDQGGGVKTYINEKLKAGSEKGHEIIIIAPGREWGVEDRFGGKVYWVKGPRLPVDWRYTILWREKAVHEILNAENPDVVEGSSPWTGGWFAGRWKGDALKSFIFHQDPVAAYPHTVLGNLIGFDNVDRIFSFYWKYLQKLSSKFDATVVSGDWLARRLEKFGVNNPVAVPFGIDKSFFSTDRRDPELRARLLSELGLPESASLFIAISRHHPEKRLGALIDGFHEASKEKPMGLIIYGDGPFRKYVDYKANGAKNVKVMGFTKNRNELANTLASTDYFIHGSSSETYGIVVAEAVCSGIPIIVPQRGGAGDIASWEYAETYETGNRNSLKQAIINIVSRDREKMAEQCTKVGDQGISTINEHFDLLFETYQKLLDEKIKVDSVIAKT